MTAAATTPVNGSNVNSASTAGSNPNLTSSRQQLKMNSLTKSSDGARKQTGSPVDGGQRKAPPQKAWTQGTNPITQRPNNPTTSNGINSSKTIQNPPQLSSEPMQVLTERMMYLLANVLGLGAEITLKNGEKYTGVLSGTTPEPQTRHIFKMVKRVQPAGDAPINGAASFSDEYIGSSDDHVVVFDAGDIADLYIPNVVLDGHQAKTQNGASIGFRTDTDISGSTGMRQRELRKWESGEPDVDHSLGSTSRSTEWDQFSTNERLFGVKSDYDENLYTTTIDRSNPQYAEKAAHAERIAREIESSNALNAHVREERGHASTDDHGENEEDKYSGVRRDFAPLQSGTQNKYTPPARRTPPTGQPTVPGAPVDPAIISSQLARPDSAMAKAVRAGLEPPKSEATQKSDMPPSSDLKTTKDAAVKIGTTPSATVPTIKDQSEKSSSGTKDAATSVPLQKSAARPDNATNNVENVVLGHFKKFAAQERQQISERRQQSINASREVRLNDLKKFSQNFKLGTPVPSDLVPILAKDELKQKEIIQKALQAAQEKKSSSAQSTPTEETKPSSGVGSAKPASSHASPGASTDRQQNQRHRPGPGHFGSAAMRGSNAANQMTNQKQPIGLLSSRLAYNHQQHRQNMALPPNHIPQPIPTGPSAPSNNAQASAPNMSSRFNVRAPDFRPNPAASTFRPGDNQSTNTSPRPDSAPRQDVPRKASEPQETSFFGGQRPTVVKSDALENMFNPIKRMLKEHQEAAADPSTPAGRNGGIPFAFNTQPTWDIPPEHADREYISMFENGISATQPPAPNSAANNGHVPHQHQLPPHLQGPPPQGNTPGHTPRHLPVQPHGPGGAPHFESHNMQFSHSTSSVHPSPRPMHPYMYGAQPQAMPGFAQQTQMPYNGMSPVPPHAALRQQGGPQFMNGPLPGMGGQMMTTQHSNGPFMAVQGNPQMQMYSPGPGPGYPHYPNPMGAVPGANGYSSPRPSAQMMHHQGSQQGHQQQPFVFVPPGAPMYTQMQPGAMPHMRQQPYNQPHQSQNYGSPQQHHPFPQAHRGTPSASYAQPMMQQHSMPPQGPPSNGPANLNQESNEDAK